MNELQVLNISKTFKLSKKQQLSSKIDSKILTAVDDVSFSLSKGKIYGLLGPNGAGKTTTLRIISSLIAPNKGSVLYNGKDINEDILEYRRKVGFLTSELKLDDFFTPDYTFYYMSKLYGINDKEISKRKEELFKRFGIDNFKHVKIKELSTGMKQKVSLAISLCHDPEIIIFDEPTNGLDIIASRDVDEFLRSFKGGNKVVLISTHIFSLVEKLCDDVGIIVNGKLIINDTLENIKNGNSLEDAFFKITEGILK
ncbi:MAG: ABC transporter ATP-binding protein [Bacillales bacterium]